MTRTKKNPVKEKTFVVEYMSTEKWPRYAEVRATTKAEALARVRAGHESVIIDETRFGEPTSWVFSGFKVVGEVEP